MGEVSWDWVKNTLPFFIALRTCMRRSINPLPISTLPLFFLGARDLFVASFFFILELHSLCTSIVQIQDIPKSVLSLYYI